MERYKVIDLFAGAGGLSLGFQQTQKYDIKVAFENSPYMQETYKKNHPNVEVQGDVCAADYKAIQKRYGPIDVVIGGPPCQGFSNANRQKNHAISQNNMLVKQYLRAILELQPKAFVMENVGSLKSEVHRFYMEKRDLDIVEKYGIPVRQTPLHLIDAEFVFDGALDVIKNPDCIRQYLWPESDYAELNVIYKTRKNTKKLQSVIQKHRTALENIAIKYTALENDDVILSSSSRAFSAIVDYFNSYQSEAALLQAIEPAIMIQRMLSKAKEIFDHDIVVDWYDTSDGISAMIRSFAVFDYLRIILEKQANGYTINSSVLCAADYGAPQKRMRFIVMGIRKDIASKIDLPKGSFFFVNYRTVRDAIEDLELICPEYDIEEDKTGIPLAEMTDCGDLCRLLRDSSVLRNHIATKTTETALERFRALKQGENFHSLSNELKTNTYTDAARTQNTIYLRLNYDEPSGTVVNVRKSMWIHPVKNRAISIREAARLQTFPDSFVFYGSKDKQYQQVGNAVPPIMAKAIAKKLFRTLQKAETEGDIVG